MTIESITGRTHTPLTIKTTQKAEIDSGKNASVKSPKKMTALPLLRWRKE